MGHYYLQVILPENTPDTNASKLLALETLLNPLKGKEWDRYRIGGRWDGAILGKIEIAGCYNEGKQHECLDNNCTTTDALIEQVKQDSCFTPYSVLTPDGAWWEFLGCPDDIRYLRLLKSYCN